MRTVVKKLWNMIHSYSIVFIVAVRCCDMIGYVLTTYCACKEVVYDKAVLLGLLAV